MPALADPQVEIFAQGIAAGLDQTKAAKRAGYLQGPHNVGHRLKKRTDVLRRITELQSDPNKPLSAPTDEVADSAMELYTTKPWVVRELVMNHTLARKKKEFAASNVCLIKLAEMGGHLGQGAAKLPSLDAKADLALLGMSEMHAMLQRLVGKAAPDERRQLLAASPELAEIVQDVSIAEASKASEPTEQDQ